MHGEDTIGGGGHEAENLLGAEHTKQDAGEHEKSDAPAVAPRPQDAAKVHAHHDAEKSAGGEGSANVVKLAEARA
jgi:hypothetical protein